MTTDAKKIEVQKAALDGAEIEEMFMASPSSWELVTNPIRWNWDDFDYRVAAVKPVSAFMARWVVAKEKCLPGSLKQHKNTWNAALGAVLHHTKIQLPPQMVAIINSELHED